MNEVPKIVDLFSGCGGFGLGAELAGFKSIAAIDVDSTLQSAYAKNFPETRVIKGDLSEMTEESWKLILNNTEIDGVIGGPPCQGYSRMGHSDINDPRRSLLGHFFRNVNIIKPKFFIMENVQGLMDKKNVYELEAALEMLCSEYHVLEPTIIDASEFGAPTRRKRVIVVGYLPEFVDRIDVSDLKPIIPITTNVKDAIYDIGEPIKQSKDKGNFGWADYRKVKEISSYAKMMRKLPPEGLGSSEVIDHLKAGKVSGNFDTIHTESVKERYEQVKQGETDSISRAKKLAWNGLCPTLRAGTGSDKGSHQAVRPIHPKKSRVITVREAARLQGFPDWFCFHPTKWHSFRMIGNSVSPLVSYSILKKIKSKMVIEKKTSKTG
jgi:DNA (cytosine-5)-methyltransferase 1